MINQQLFLNTYDWIAAIQDPIERTIVEQLGITKAEYDANGVSNYVSAWIAADNGVTLDGSNHIVSVADKSGNGNDAIPLESPTEIIPNALNSLPAFKNIPTGIEVSGLKVDTGGAAGYNTIFIVAKTGVEDQYAICSKSNSFSYIGLNGNATSTAINAGVTDPSILINQVESTLTNRSTLNAELRAFDYSIITIEASFNWNDIVFMGTTIQPNGWNFDDEWYEALVFPGQLTVQQRESIEGQLAEKYGLPLATAPWVQAISDPVEREIVVQLQINKTEYDANGVSNYVRAWYEADSGVTTPGTDVTAWADKSGNGNDLTTAAGSPQFNASNSNLNNQPSIDLDGNDAMQAASALMNIEVGDCTIIGIYDTASTYVASEQDEVSPYSSNIIIGGHLQSASLWINTKDVRTGEEKLGLYTVTNDADGKAVIYQNIAELGTILNPTRNVTQSVFTLGAAVDLSAFHTGPIPIFIIIPGLLTQSQREAIELVIAEKYGLPLPQTQWVQNIVDPVEREVVLQFEINKAEYDANGISSVAELYLTAENATFDGSNNLTAWTDSSGNSEPVTVSVTPPFRGTSLNGIDGVANNGNSNTELTLDSYPLTNTSTFELFVVARPSVRVQSDLIAGIFSSDVNNGLLTSETFQISDDDTSGLDAEDTTWSIRQDAVKGQVGKVYTNGALFGVRRNGTTMAGDLNGVNQLSYTAPAATCAFQRMGLLINRGSNRAFNGSVFNCLLLNTSITDSQRQAINLAIGEKFGLPIEGVAWFDAITDPVEKSIVQAFSIHKDEYDANGVSNYIAAWYDATQGVTGFPSVTSWLDRSNNILATSIGPDLPVVATNEDTNTTAIRWNTGNVDQMTAAQNIVPGTANRTVFATIERVSNSATSRVFMDGNIFSYNPGELYILSNEPAIRIGNAYAEFTTALPNTIELITSKFEGINADDINLRINASDISRTSLSNQAINTTGNKFEIGQDTFAGDILDLIISPHALMQYQVDLIEGGLATKHGLPFGDGSWFNSLTASQQTWVTNNNITEYEFDEADTLYGDAFSAWSLRWVNPKQYTGPVGRVRRSSDDAELDFDANDVQSGALLTFVGANDGHLVKLYDQTGNGNDLETNDTTQQPMIISAGANVVQAGRLAFDADTFGTGSVKGFQVLNTNPGGAKEGLYNFLHDGTTIASSSSVLTTTSNGFSMVYQSGTSPGTGYILNGGNDDRINIHGAGEVFDANTSDGNSSYHSFVQLDPGNVNVPDRVDLWKAGVDRNFNENVSTGTASLANHNISFSVFRPATGQVYGQELVIWNIDKAAQRTQIEADVNKYYTL